MKLRALIKVAEHYTINNSPTLLSAMAVSGTLATAYLTGKATFRASAKIHHEETRRAQSELYDNAPDMTSKDKAKLVWTCYVPPAVAVVSTVGCIVTANTISTRRMAALAATIAIAERNFGEYKEKVREVFGDNKERDVRDKIAEDRIANHQPTERQILVGNGNVLCYDKYSGRYFESTMEDIKSVENQINKGLYRSPHADVATLSDFYDLIGLDRTKFSDDVGWSADRPLELRFSSVLTEKGLPVLVMDFNDDPFPVRSYFGHP